jgi:hypothetical protein
MHESSSRRPAPGAARGHILRRHVPAVVSLWLAAAPAFAQFDQDRIDLTGRQNLTLGSGARAYGMGGAFLARPDDGTAASWNPAGLSYLRLPELSLVGNYNYIKTTEGPETDVFEGGLLDFASFTWPVAIGEVAGAVQLGYQRGISFDGTRKILSDFGRWTLGRSDGGFDVVSFGSGFRPTRRLHVGLTVNRWLNGYEQTLSRFVPGTQRPRRDFDLDMRPGGWNFHLGFIFQPLEELNVAGVLKTPFTADVTLDKRRSDYWFGITEPETITYNTHRSEAVSLEFPSSFGVGVSWRPLDTLTLSADFTRTGWSSAVIREYFELPVTLVPEPGQPPSPPPPVVFDELPYPTLIAEQEDAEQVRVGVEYVLIKGHLKVPFRAGYFSDRQITRDLSGSVPRFDGITMGAGIILGSLLLDLAYLYEFGSYSVTVEADAPDAAARARFTIPYSLHTQRVFASLIYRFSARP